MMTMWQRQGSRRRRQRDQLSIPNRIHGRYAFLQQLSSFEDGIASKWVRAHAIQTVERSATVNTTNSAQYIKVNEPEIVSISACKSSEQIGTVTYEGIRGRHSSSARDLSGKVARQALWLQSGKNGVVASCI